MNHDVLHMLNLVHQSVFYFGGNLMTLLYSDVTINSYLYINGEGGTTAMCPDTIRLP